MWRFCLAFMFSLVISVPVAVAQDRPLPNFSLEDLDNKLKSLESKAETDARFKDIYSRSEVDTKIQELRSASAQGASRSEIDARIGDLQKIFDAAEQRNSVWRSDLEKRVVALETKAPPISPWIAVFISIAAAAVSGFGIYWSYRTANSVAADNRAEGRRTAQEARADAIVNAWQGLSGKIGRALGLFRNPDAILDPNGSPNSENYELLVELGNWYDRMAEQWRSGSADTTVLRSAGLKRQAEEFWKGLEIVEAKLSGIRTQMTDWNNLRWLATTPDA
jgi:hypothetical protein